MRPSVTFNIFKKSTQLRTGLCLRGSLKNMPAAALQSKMQLICAKRQLKSYRMPDLMIPSMIGRRPFRISSWAVTQRVIKGTIRSRKELLMITYKNLMTNCFRMISRIKTLTQRQQLFNSRNISVIRTCYCNTQFAN